MVWNAIFIIKFIVIVVRLSVRANGSQAVKMACKWQWNGNCINGVVCLIIQALCWQGTGNREWQGKGRGNGHIHAGQLPKALPLLTWANTHTKQIGGYYCHYNEYCYPFNAKWLPDMPREPSESDSDIQMLSPLFSNLVLKLSYFKNKIFKMNVLDFKTWSFFSV